MFILRLISSRMSFVFVTVAHRYFNFSIFSNDRFSIIIFYTIFCGRDVIVYLVFSEFTSKLMSLLAFIKISVFSLTVCKFSQNILTLSA